METQAVEDRRKWNSGGALSQIIKLSEIPMSSNRQETIKAVLKKTGDIFPECRICFIGLKDGKLAVEDGIPPSGHGVGEVITTKTGKFFLKSVIDGGKTIVVNNPLSDKRLDYLKTLIERYQISGIMFSPLRCVGGINFGVLVADALHGRIFSPEDKQLMKTISCIASLALYRERQKEESAAKALEREKSIISKEESLRKTMAHALRNRLMSIGGFASVIERKIAHNEKLKALKRYSRVIIDEVGTMEYIVSAVLDLSRPAVLSLEKCSINNLLMKEIKKYRLSYSGVSFRSSLDWRLSGVTLMIDKCSLQICLSDLVVNARDAGATTVTIETKLTKTQCIITVTNNGHDIDPLDQEDIFEMFMTSKPRGTGLGLPTARHIVNGHGGEIKVHSKDGRTMFEITLPRYLSAK